MSSLQSLIEGGGDCGAANPVVELARQFTQSTSASASVAAAAEDPTASLIRDIHHPETLLGHQQQQQQPIGASFSAAAHLLNSSLSSVQQLERQQNAAAPFDMNALLEQMREMDSAMERAMKRGHEDYDPEHPRFVEEQSSSGKLSGTADPLLCSGSTSLEDVLQQLDSGWEEALKLSNQETSSVDTSFGGPSASSGLIDESWEEALLATVGTPETLLSAEEASALPGGGNNWVDEYFRTLDAKIDGIEAEEEAAQQSELHSYRGRSIAVTEQEQKQKVGPGFDDFSSFFQSMSSTIDNVASGRAAPSSSTSSQLPRGVRAEMTFNLNELVSDQEERLMNMLLSGNGGGLQEEDEENVSPTLTSAAQIDPDQMLNLDAIGRREEDTSAAAAAAATSESQASTSSDFKMPQSLLDTETSKPSAPEPRTAEEKFFYENQFDDMEFWMKLAEDWEHNPLDLEAAIGEPAKPVLIHEPLEELLKPEHLHHYYFTVENPFRPVEQEEEEAVQDSSEAMKTDEAPAAATEEEEDFEQYIARGLAKLEVGDIPAAILLFEAAAAIAPHSSRAWLLLGTAQAKNENDRKAIGAMKRCLVLEPDNLEALLCLAVSFTNESQTAEACAALREWLAVHPQYRHYLEEAEAQEKNRKEEEELSSAEQSSASYMGPTPLSKRWGASSSSSTANSSNIFTSGLFERIKGVFIRAATETVTSTTTEMDTGAEEDDHMQPSVDADVQCGLGVLFSLSGDYEKAVDCFRTAVAVRPQDHTLWNRLGATLANGGRSAEAMSAYREALLRYPGYIRARHNLAIACLMLGANQEAVGHLLAVLNLQMAGSRSAATADSSSSSGQSSSSSVLAEIIANPSSITSASVWSLLRTALLALNREDLFPAVTSRDLQLLNREFSFIQQAEADSSSSPNPEA